MCGIVGAMSNYLIGHEIDRFKELMLVSNLRGSDGAGVIRVNTKEEVSYIRSAGNGIDVTKAEEFNTLVKVGPNPTCLIGHTRWPTRGDNTVDNAHPHHTKHIVGVHNGTMDKIMGTVVPKGASDSALLFEAIAEHGIEKAMRGSDGAVCIVYCDTKEGTINFYRNFKRPLWFGVLEGRRTIYWASEKSFLSLILGRAGHKFEAVELEASKLQTYDLKVGAPIAIKERTELFMYYNPPTHTPHVPRVITPPTTTVPEVAPKDAPFRSEGPIKPTILHYPGASTSIGTRTRNDRQSSGEKNNGSELPAFLTRSGNTSGKSSETHPPTTSTDTGGTGVPEHARTRTRYVQDAKGNIRPKPDVEEFGGEDRGVKADQPAVDDTDDYWSRLEGLSEKDYGGPEIIYKQTIPNHHVSVKRYIELVKSGCEFCGESIEGPLAGMASTPVVNWFDATKWLCEDCAQDDDVIKQCGADQYLLDQFSGRPKLHFWSEKQQRYVYE